MKLKEIKITGFFGGEDKTISYSFHEDLNILTGRNGSGKTTILKLIWFIISGNISLALKEINFITCKLITSEYECIVNRINKDSCEIYINIFKDNQSFHLTDELDEDGIHLPFLDSAEEKAERILKNIGNTLFFPTFRRIEGGFSITNSEEYLPRSVRKAISDFDEALTDLSKKLSHGSHSFIAAISSKDINNLLLRKYADYSEQINIKQREITSNVISKISAFEDRNETEQSNTANSLLLDTKREIEQIEEYRNKVLQPLQAVNKLVENLFNHSGISFGKRLTFGESTEAIYSDELSAGEKQMLSFICYNAFYNNSIIFVDEPELSLHTDWQRQLYFILKEQNPSNQFIFATHSPFIYSKYPDKELIINFDKGEAINDE